MTTRRHGRPFRTATARVDLRLFLLTGVATVLLARWLLARTGYPKLGGHGTGLHIAHMLWGGLLMAAGLVVLLVFLGRRVRLWGSVTGGVGFGLHLTFASRCPRRSSPLTCFSAGGPGVIPREGAVSTRSARWSATAAAISTARPPG